MDDLVVGRVVIPAEELRETFTTSGGPGGQHANRSATSVELRFDVGASDVFDEADRERIVARWGPVVTVVASDSRSQWRNRAIARQRLAERISEAMQPATPRRRTRPTRASKMQRIESKRRQSEKKRLRRRPDL